MFTRKEQLIARTGKNKVGRYEFLKLLISEFKTSKSREAKTQVLANLANFAYDPINYEYLRQLKAVDLFLHLISEDNVDFVRFAIGGICNLSLDPENKEYIIHSNGPQLVSSLLTSSDEETVLSAITTLMFLVTPASKPQITAPEIINSMIHFSNSSNYRIKNLALVFLSDYCSKTDVENSLIMNSRLVGLWGRQMKLYCTKIPSESVPGQCSNNLKPGNRVTVTRVITQEEILGFAELTSDYNPIHLTSPRNIVHGAYLNGLVSGVIGTKLPGPGTMVVEQLIRYPKPCYAGDTVLITVEILSARKIIKCKYSCVANNERLVLEGEAKLVLSESFAKKIGFVE